MAPRAANFDRNRAVFSAEPGIVGIRRRGQERRGSDPLLRGGAACPTPAPAGVAPPSCVGRRSRPSLQESHSPARSPLADSAIPTRRRAILSRARRAAGWHRPCARRGVPPGPSVYQRRSPGDTVLYRIVRDPFETFRAQAAGLRDREGLPQFVEQAFRNFLRCGWLAGGFARFRCAGCGFDRLVAFSCKGRELCPSCGGAPDG